MGDVVNSRFEDYGPTLGKDKSILYFTSKRNKNENVIMIQIMRIFSTQKTMTATGTKLFR